MTKKINHALTYH